MKKLLLCCLAGLVPLIFLCGTWAYSPEDCSNCHREGSTQSNLHISVQGFEASIHSREMGCQDCHISVKDADHEKQKGSVTVDCRPCHEKKNGHGFKSKGRNHPTCQACHTKHTILEKDNELSSVHPDQLKTTCKKCHPVECGGRNYVSWLPSIRLRSHNKQDFSLSYGKDNCVGCHQGQAVHGEKGPIDQQKCHVCHLASEGRGALWGFIHPRGDFNKQPAIFVAACIYFASIAVLLWMGVRFCARKPARKKRG